jgi:hypothetical protein
MNLALGSLNLVLGLVYTSYGILTVLDLWRGWRVNGFSHFGAAWIAMAFTCGPHHLHHAEHLLVGAHHAGVVDLVAVLGGAPAGVIWFLLRIEAFRGGRGDRRIDGTPGYVRSLPWLAAALLGLLVGLTVVTTRGPFEWNPQTTPNVILVGAYALIGAYLLQGQLDARRATGGWSLSGLALTLVFPTCASMHAAWVLYAGTGQYHLSIHGIVLDWLSVPAAIYFLAVVRSLHVGGPLRDWNRAVTA